jgi:CDP-diacylglycerol--glycerol-3-phosphate 3-phosphatidyltransferase
VASLSVLSTPNLLTFFRIGVTPPLIYLLTLSGPISSAVAALLFFFATLSDYLDGYIARSYGTSSILGKFLDPIADKVLVTAALVMLTAIARQPRVPAWLVVILVAREIAVTGMRAIAAAEGILVGAEELGKYKMVLQSAALESLMIHYSYLHIDFFAAGLFLLWIATALSIWSAIEYHIKVISAIKARHATPAQRAAAG